MKNNKVVLLQVLDIFLINFIYFAALMIRFDFHLSPNYWQMYLQHALIITAIKVLIFHVSKLYFVIWRYASVSELFRIIFAVFVSNAMTTLYLLMVKTALPRSIYPIVLVLDILFLGGIRMIPKLLTAKKKGLDLIDKPFKNTLIIGAGDAGVMVIKELKKHPELGNRPIGIIDDDREKKSKTINGIPVLGDRHAIAKVVERYDVEEIIVALPSVDKTEQREILVLSSDTPAKVRMVPGVYEFIDSNINLNELRDVQIEDLLGRDEVHLNLDELQGFLSHKRILVTGGGGSIGSELCRQIAKYQPEKLMILDIYENTTYEIQNELKREFPDLNLSVFIESVRDRERIHQIFEAVRPQIIFHAAAHKHVPLMEGSPQSAIKNNVFGTLNVMLEADAIGVEKFVMISTDKAVNPTNVMGATKRIGEMLIQSFNERSKTEYVAVRFGNVLGSNGSVIPLFKRQIAEGGPVTVTDERIIRYFMTIPEACQLVLQAGAIAGGGEIFILDMGEPVKIIDLATRLIRLSGLEPYRDIDIVITGLRPGEKLYEELLLDKSKVTETSHQKIYIEKPLNLDFNELETQLVDLLKATKSNVRGPIIHELEKIVPTFVNFDPSKGSTVEGINGQK